MPAGLPEADREQGDRTSATAAADRPSAAVVQSASAKAITSGPSCSESG
ncbi:hypothetical protein [Streptomyces sp. NE5-10]|nr:hypothetical protein [Streptomyces sp. NE5-10]